MSDVNSGVSPEADATDKELVSGKLKVARLALARALWAVEVGKAAPGEDRESVFSEDRAAYMAKASKIIRLLERRGFELTAAESVET